MLLRLYNTHCVFHPTLKTTCVDTCTHTHVHSLHTHEQAAPLYPPWHPDLSHRTLEEIGQGQFGTVHRGILQTSEGPKEVAIKMLHEGSSSSEKVKFLQEAAIIGQFYHSAIVRLWGVVLKGDPVGV